MTSKEVKKFCQKFDTSVRVRSINGRANKMPITWYIEARFNTTRELRAKALHIIYGNDFEINEMAIAGNVTNNSISMPPIQWETLITN